MRTAHIANLKNGRSYKFQIQCCNMNGTGEISCFSNTITPAIVLPDGWKQVQDAVSGKDYYFHTKTKQTQWTRPQGREKTEAGAISADKDKFSLSGTYAS